MLLHAHTDFDGTAANTIWVHHRLAKFRVSVRKVARSPHGKSLAPLAHPGASAPSGGPNVHPGRLHARCRRPRSLVEKHR
jgi:hypothetical protein